jgi:hypothetical protein
MKIYFYMIKNLKIKTIFKKISTLRLSCKTIIQWKIYIQIVPLLKKNTSKLLSNTLKNTPFTY